MATRWGRFVLVAVAALAAAACASLTPGGNDSAEQALAIQTEVADAVLSGSLEFLEEQGVERICFGAAAMGAGGSADAPVRRIPLVGPPRRDRRNTEAVMAGMHGQGWILYPLYECQQSGRAYVVGESGQEGVLLRINSPTWIAQDLVDVVAGFDHEDFTYAMTCRMRKDREGWWVDYCRCRRSRGPDACPSIG